MRKHISTFKKTVLSKKLLGVGIIALAVTSSPLLAQNPVTSYIISNQVPSPKTAQPNVPGYPIIATANFAINSFYNLLYAQRNGNVNGNSRTVTGFNAAGITFEPYNKQTGDNSFTKVVFNRRESATPIGQKYTALYEYSEIRNSSGAVINNVTSQTLLPNGSSVYFEPSFETTMEGFMNSYSLNKGTDNVFVNDAANNSTSNNIERIDLVYSNGVIATNSANRSRVGFLVNERGGNDNFSVAAITSIDANNNVTGLSPIKKFNASVWGKVGPTISTTVIQKNGNSTIYQPSQLISGQTVSGVYISLAALDIAANTKVYGIALFPEDAASDLVGLSDANTNTLGTSGLDLMSGNFAAKDVTLIYATLAGTVFNDANGLNGNPAYTVDGTRIGNPSGVQLYANLLDANNIVVLSVPVNITTGNYSFENVSPGNYTIQISTLRGSVLDPAPSQTLPSGWVNTGESNNGLGTLSDGIANGLTNVTVATTNISNINFGIEELPDSKNLSTIIAKPSIGDFITLSGGTNPPLLQGMDPEDLKVEGVLTGRSVEITTVPTTSELYYDFGAGSELLTSGKVINNFDGSKLQIKITDKTKGESQTSFEYAFIDAAGLKDSTPAIYEIHWSGSLPVTLSKFEVSNENNIALLNWQTTMESNSSHFEVQHSLNGKVWSTVATVESTGSVKQSVMNYSYSHPMPKNGTNYYRLKMVDLDATYSYSRIQSLSFSGISSAWLFPNPVSDVLFINDESLDVVKSVIILNSNGVPVYSANIISKEGINVKGLSNGLYLLKITLKDGGQKTQKVFIRR